MVDTGIANIFPPFDQTSEQTLQANLARHGLEPGDVGLIVHTHVHVDHVGYDDQLPRRGSSSSAASWSTRRTRCSPFLYDPADHAKLTGPLRDRVEIVDGDADIAPGIRTVRTGGHTPHHQMVYVDVPSGQAVITGDNVYAADPGRPRACRPATTWTSSRSRLRWSASGPTPITCSRCTTATCTSAIRTACGRRARR